MTRTEFIRFYASFNGYDDDDVTPGYLGTLKTNDGVMVALPCACSSPDCKGWAMLFAENVPYHLAFSAPEELRNAYQKAVYESEKKR